AQLEQGRHVGRSLEPANIENAAARYRRRGVVGREAQKTEPHLGFVVRGHEGALALAAQQQVFGGQFVDGLAHRTLADLKARRELELAGYCLARLPFATVEPLQQQSLDLLIQGAERRTATGSIRVGASIG